ncbi:MAG: helix-turn-helix transcriptional regulator [Pseudomonadales bacterium]|nr:helix-turn-helix transcriptional regulator [Pseudomonadales bacterium]
MLGDDELTEVMDAIYFASHQKGGWQGCLERIARLFAADSARLLMLSKDNGEPVVAYQSRVSTRLEKEREAGLSLCEVCHDMDEAHLELVVQRPAGEGPFSEDDRQHLEVLMPHIARAMRQEAVARVLNDRQAAVQQQKQGALLLLDGEQNVVFLSSEAEDLLSRTGAMKLEEGRLRLVQRQHQVALDTLIQGCFDSKSSGMINLSGSDPVASRLLVSTVQPRNHELFPSHGLVAVFVVAGECEETSKEDVIGQWLGLTGAEARVAGLIAQGRRPAEIAEEIELSVHTVRHHIKSIYRKTGAHSQSQLTALVLNLPA